MQNDPFKDKVFLTQTDTTIGFVSQNAERITTIKQRPPHKHYIKAVNSLQTLTQTVRVPTAHKKRVRRSKKTTFILPDGKSYRVIQDTHHLLLLDRLKWAYTSSANLSGESYDGYFARKAADVIIEPIKATGQPSHIYKLGNKRLRRIR
ncbi:MAG TPA: Sua5 YciO YrdC YwlC family protein [Sulfurovum sp.]|uniref:Sua5 YciO YrdC YwlC family protein n=1 Tax=Sulfurovum sp. TaxID=1969726 RepID=UPI002F91CF77